jgi:hypothetical protein
MYLLVAVDQTVETNKGDACNDNKNEQNDDATYDPFSYSVSSLGGFPLGLFPDCGETISLKLIGNSSDRENSLLPLDSGATSMPFCPPETNGCILGKVSVGSTARPYAEGITRHIDKSLNENPNMH